MNNKLEIGHRFAMGRIICEVTSISKFGPEPHYGFRWNSDAGAIHAGWMPVEFVDNFTGHLDRPCLWSFNFEGGGFNSVRAVTKDGAFEIAKAAFPSLADKIVFASFVPRRTSDEEAAYYASIPLMD